MNKQQRVYTIKKIINCKDFQTDEQIWNGSDEMRR